MPTQFPIKVTIPLSFQIEVQDQEGLDYYTNSQASPPPSGDRQAALGFIADLFDIFDMEGTIKIESINGLTHEAVKKHFQQLIP
jgi:hypothetical protein